MRVRGRRGDTVSNMIIFLTLLIAAMLLVTWYIQSVRPTRFIIGAVTEDIQETGQHLANACFADIYGATYLFSTSTGFYESNTTHYCIYTEVFGTCRPLPCSGINATRFPLGEAMIVRIEKDNGPVTMTPQ